MTKSLFYSAIISFFIGCIPITNVRKSKNTTSNIFRPKIVKIYTQTDKKSLGPCEPSIAINPKDPKNLVAGSVLDYVHVSNDGGLNWTTKKLISEFGIWGDPVVLASKKGEFYYFHLSDPEGTNWKSTKILDRIVVQKSTDKGLNWSKGNSIGLNSPKQQDKQWACINPKNNQMYVTWTEFDSYNSDLSDDHSRILFSASNDLGKSWSAPVNIGIHEGDCKDDDFTTEGAVPSSDGKNIYVSWAYDHNIWFTKSTDQGKSWLPQPTKLFKQNAGWSFELPVVKRANGFPVTAVDISKSKYKGTIYINWSDQSAEGNTEVFISKSNDQGTTWSMPKLVHTKNPEVHHFFNWMKVDPITGYIYIVYYKGVDINNSYVNVELSVSKDAGKSFKNYQITKNPFNPKGANFFGDYNNIDAYKGTIRPIWTQVEDGLVSVWTALIQERDLK